MRSISRWTILVLAVLAPVGSLAAIGIASAASAPKALVCKDVTANGGNYQATGIRVTKMGCAEARTYLATWLKQGSKSLPHYKQYWHARKIAGGRWLAAYGTTKVPPTITFMIKVPRTRSCADVIARGGKYKATGIRVTGIGCVQARNNLASWLRQGSKTLPHNPKAWHSKRIAGGRWRVEYGTKKSRPTIAFMIKAVHKPAPPAPTPPAPDTQAPAITLSAPAEGARYELGQAVTAHFECTDNVQVASCSGTLPDGSALPTDKLGTFTFTVTATDTAGNTATKTVTYSVVDTTPPKITVASPTDGAKLEAGAAMTARFTCTDNVAVATCNGTFADGAAIPTDVVGAHQFVVVATDTFGNMTSVAVNYTVVDTTPPKITITSPVSGASYSWGQTAQFSCTDIVAVASCTASVGGTTVANGAPLPPSAAAGATTSTLTVTAKDTSGNTSTQTISNYVVQPAGYYALTFHDGPNGDYTQKVLDALKSVNAHATFFLVGSQVQQYPALAQAIVAAGMQVGNHTMNHLDVAAPALADGSPNPFFVGPAPAAPDTPTLEITDGRDAIIAAIPGVTLKWFEPPFGDYGTDSAVQTMVTAAGETLCAWTVDSTDSSSPQPTSAQIVAAATQVAAGGIIEMHDASQATVDAVAPIVTQLANNKGLLPGQITASATGVPGPFGSPQPAFFCTAGAWPAS